MDEQTLDELLSKEAIKRGWADNKIQYVTRILKYIQAEDDDIKPKVLQNHFKEVIKYLEAYKFDD
jgi:hypothetical protein